MIDPAWIAVGINALVLAVAWGRMEGRFGDLTQDMAEVKSALGLNGKGDCQFVTKDVADERHEALQSEGERHRKNLHEHANKIIAHEFRIETIEKRIK